MKRSDSVKLLKLMFVLILHAVMGSTENNATREIPEFDQHTGTSLNETRTRSDDQVDQRLVEYSKREGCSISFVHTRDIVHNSSLYEENELLYYFKCDIGPERVWDFEGFRNLTNGLPSTSSFIALDIRCGYNGGIRLPWPYRASHLRYLFVDKCNIYGYYDEYFDESIVSTPDTIQYFEIKDPAIHMDVDDLIRNLRFSETNMTKASRCGPEHTYAWVLRNISYVFPPPNPQLERNMTEVNIVTDVAKSYFQQLVLRPTIRCFYDNLKVIDRSGSLRISKELIENMVKYGNYPALSVFNLTHTLLVEIPPRLKEWRLYFPRMKYLDLRYNNIKEFKSIVDHGRENEDPTVGVIDLRNNNITTISYRSLRTIRRHTSVKVDIRDNPFNCVCEMRDFVNYLRKPHNNLTKDAHITGYKYMYLNDLTCANPPLVRGRRIAALTDEELGCEIEIPKIERGPIIALSFMLFFILFAVFLFIRYREEITILAFTRLNIILPCHGGEHDDNKKYDAFVAYSQDDTDWVINVLRARLEKPDNGVPFNLCLHHRDFEVGAAIFDNILHSVKNSRHTILVVSKKFLQSEWCLMEFRTAFHQSLLEKKKHLIIVLLEKIPDAEMDLDFKRCLKTLTYAEVDDNLFWDKLIYALSKKNRKRRNKQVNDAVNNQFDMNVV